MATSNAFNEQVEACIAKLLRDEYPHMKTTSVNHIAHDGALSVAMSAVRRFKEDCKGCRKLDFLDLPRELRDMIYAFIVVPSRGRGVGIGVLGGLGADFVTRQGWNSKDGDLQHPITRVCRQLREESLPLYYQLNRFWVSIDTDSWSPPRNRENAEALSSWLRAMGPANIKQLRKLTVFCRNSGSFTCAQTLDQVLAQAGVTLPEEVDFHRIQAV